MKRNLKKLAPPGSNVKTTVAIFRGGIIILALVSIVCPLRIYNEWYTIFHDALGNYRDSGSSFMSFGFYARESMFFLWAILLFAIAFGVANYMSFSKETKSIYVMKRIPNKYEMFNRSFAIPLTAALYAVVIAALLLIMYSLIYSLALPADRIEVVRFADFMRAFI